MFDGYQSAVIFFLYRETKEKLIWVKRGCGGRTGWHRGRGDCGQEVKYEIRIKVKKNVGFSIQQNINLSGYK